MKVGIYGTICLLISKKLWLLVCIVYRLSVGITCWNFQDLQWLRVAACVCVMFQLSRNVHVIIFFSPLRLFCAAAAAGETVTTFSVSWHNLPPRWKYTESVEMVIYDNLSYSFIYNHQDRRYKSVVVYFHVYGVFVRLKEQEEGSSAKRNQESLRNLTDICQIPLNTQTCCLKYCFELKLCLMSTQTQTRPSSYICSNVPKWPIAPSQIFLIYPSTLLRSPSYLKHLILWSIDWRVTW